MSSWVRYCVAVYVGLLISGALARPSWTHPSGSMPDAGLYPAQRSEPSEQAPPGLKAPNPGVEADASAALTRRCATLSM